MVLGEVSPLHISTTGMDAHTWLVFAIALGPSVVMMVVVALRIRQDAREDAAGETLGGTRPDPPVR